MGENWGNMANYKTQAINLKSYNFGEADKIIVMYSRDHGIIRCIAKGVRRYTSKLGGRMEMLISNNLLLANGKNLDIICQADLVDSFKEIRKDISKLTYAVYCAEMINTFGLENDSNSSRIYDVFFESLKNISLASSTEDILWTIIRFKLKLMKLLGYAVELNSCVKCSEPVKNNQYFFCADSGGIICKSCQNELSGIMDLDHDILKIFKNSLNSDYADNCYNRILLDSCFNILKEYISLRSHKKFKSPELIECLC